MLENSIRRTPRPQDLIGLSTQELRDTFAIASLFVAGDITGHFTDLEGSPITLQSKSVLATNGRLHERILAALR